MWIDRLSVLFIGLKDWMLVSMTACFSRWMIAVLAWGGVFKHTALTLWHMLQFQGRQKLSKNIWKNLTKSTCGLWFIYRHCLHMKDLWPAWLEHSFWVAGENFKASLLEKKAFGLANSPAGLLDHHTRWFADWGAVVLDRGSVWSDGLAAFWPRWLPRGLALSCLGNRVAWTEPVCSLPKQRPYCGSKPCTWRASSTVWSSIFISVGRRNLPGCLPEVIGSWTLSFNDIPSIHIFCSHKYYLPEQCAGCHRYSSTFSFSLGHRLISNVKLLHPLYL